MCARVLPDEAAHSQYEMRSFVRSDSGVLYPTGQGRLAEPSNPVSSNTVADLTPPVPVPGSASGIFPKLAVPKLAKEKPKSRPSAGKGSRTVVGYPPLQQQELPANVSADRQTVGAPKEDHQARQSRLNAYDDAIESVLRRVQETEDDVIYDQIASDFGNEEEPFIPPIVAAGKNRDRDERQAQIADTIDAVIARTFHDSDQSHSPPAAPMGSPLPYDDEDEIIEVHSVSPLKVEVTTDDVLILPPPSPQAASPIPFQTSSERKFLPEDETEASTSRRSKKPKNRQPASASSVYDNEHDVDWSSSQGKPPSPEISSHLQFGIPDSYVKLEELSSISKGKQVKDDEEDRGDVDQPLPMDAAETLMKLAGVAPPLKRLRISYGCGPERMVDDMRDGSEDREIYDPKTTSPSKPDDLPQHDIEVCSQKSPVSDQLTLEHGQRSARDERAKNRNREVTREKVELHDISAEATEPLHTKPPGKKGRPRKEPKKRVRAQKAVVITPALCFEWHFDVMLCHVGLEEGEY